MNFSWNNLVAWWIQIALIIALCAGLPWLLRLRIPRSRLWYWHALLALCLALPFVEPWAEPSASDSAVSVTTGSIRVIHTAEPQRFHLDWLTLTLLTLASGVVLRLAWLSLGVYRLRRYRAAAVPLENSSDRISGLLLNIAPHAEILQSDQVASPVTYGLRYPVVLLPPRFAALGIREQASVICHELIHIRRRDWAFTIGEEVVRSFFWFHPAIWWLLGRIQLTREQVVDQEVIRYTGDSKPYLDALLAIASLQIRADLAPAPLFLKKRHLRQRVESILSGVTMTKRTLLLPLAAAFATLPLVIGIAAWQFPLRAAPQDATDAPGVEVQMGAGKVLHRTGILYPAEALTKHISGTVVAALTLNDKGEVTDASVISGPQELRRAVIQSVLNWHFSNESAPGSTLEISVSFDAGKGPAMPATTRNPGFLSTKAVSSFDTSRLSAPLRAKVEAILPPAGSQVDFRDLTASLRNIDDHIRTQGKLDKEGNLTLMIGLATQQADAPTAIRVGGNVQAQNVLTKVVPVYPPEAKQARIQGTVRFNATIGADGTIKDLQVVSGHPMLVQSALEAVKQWVYKPTLLNGNPVEVITTIDVNYTLAQ